MYSHVPELAVTAPREERRHGMPVRLAAGLALGLIALIAVLHGSASPPASPLVATSQLDGAPCPDRPAPSGKLPNDIIPALASKWTVQLPCEDDQCSKDYTKTNEHSGGTVAVKPTDIASYKLIPRPYGDGFCAAGFYGGVDADGTDVVVFNDPVSGMTTSGSVNPRVELREMKDPTTNAGFALTEAPGKNSLSVTQRIMHLPPNGQSVTFVQVFNGEGGPFVEVMTRLCQYSWQADTAGNKCEKGKLYIMIWIDGKVGGKGGALLAPYEVGTKFNFKVDVGDGQLTFTYTADGGDPVTWTRDCTDASTCSAADSAGVYFKTGTYVQGAAQEPPNAYVLTYMYDVQTTDAAAATALKAAAPATKLCGTTAEYTADMATAMSDPSQMNAIQQKWKDCTPSTMLKAAAPATKLGGKMGPAVMKMIFGICPACETANGGKDPEAVCGSDAKAALAMGGDCGKCAACIGKKFGSSATTTLFGMKVAPATKLCGTAAEYSADMKTAMSDHSQMKAIRQKWAGCQPWMLKP